MMCELVLHVYCRIVNKKFNFMYKNTNNVMGEIFHLVMFDFSQHACLSIVTNSDGSWALLPRLPVYLNWYTLMDDNL